MRLRRPDRAPEVLERLGWAADTHRLLILYCALERDADMGTIWRDHSLKMGRARRVPEPTCPAREYNGASCGRRRSEAAHVAQEELIAICGRPNCCGLRSAIRVDNRI